MSVATVREPNGVVRRTDEWKRMTLSTNDAALDGATMDWARP